MDAENKLKNINEQNRIRQQNYYKNHKDEINAKRRNIYNLGKAKLNPQEEEQDVEPLERVVYKTDISNSKFYCTITPDNRRRNGQTDKQTLCYENSKCPLTKPLNE